MANLITVNERRERVWSLLCEGLNQHEIAGKLGVNQATISRDITILKEQSQKYIETLAYETFPFMLKRMIEGNDRILKECWQQYNKTGNLTALKIALDCNRTTMEMIKNGPLVIEVQSMERKYVDLLKIQERCA